MRAIREQENRVEKHKQTKKEKSKVPASALRAAVKSELNTIIIDLRNKYPECNTAITEELKWIITTSKISDFVQENLIEYLTHQLSKKDSAIFAAKTITNDTNEQKKLSKWLNMELGLSKRVFLPNIMIEMHDNSSKIPLYKATRRT